MLVLLGSIEEMYLFECNIEISLCLMEVVLLFMNEKVVFILDYISFEFVIISFLALCEFNPTLWV